MRGWPITFVAGALVLATVVLCVASGGASEESFHVAIRASARSSLVLFGLAFSARGLSRVFPWLLANRRYVGVSFAVSHFLHLGVVLFAAQKWPRAPIVALGNAPGALAYVFILAM